MTSSHKIYVCSSDRNYIYKSWNFLFQGRWGGRHTTQFLTLKRSFFLILVGCSQHVIQPSLWSCSQRCWKSQKHWHCLVNRVQSKCLAMDFRLVQDLLDSSQSCGCKSCETTGIWQRCVAQTCLKCWWVRLCHCSCSVIYCWVDCHFWQSSNSLSITFPPPPPLWDHLIWDTS